jgi:hypothetical protein
LEAARKWKERLAVTEVVDRDAEERSPEPPTNQPDTREGDSDTDLEGSTSSDSDDDGSSSSSGSSSASGK